MEFRKSGPQKEQVLVKESEKMQAGYWYDANNDPELIEKRIAAKDLCFDLDHTRPSNTEKRQEIIQQLLGNGPENLELNSLAGGVPCRIFKKVSNDQEEAI